MYEAHTDHRVRSRVVHRSRHARTWPLQRKECMRHALHLRYIGLHAYQAYVPKATTNGGFCVTRIQVARWATPRKKQANQVHTHIPTHPQHTKLTTFAVNGTASTKHPTPQCLSPHDRAALDTLLPDAAHAGRPTVGGRPSTKPHPSARTCGCCHRVSPTGAVVGRIKVRRRFEIR